MTFRAAVVSSSLSGGGTERVSLNVARGLEASGAEVDVVVLHGEGEFASEAFSSHRVEVMTPRGAVTSACRTLGRVPGGFGGQAVPPWLPLLARKDGALRRVGSLASYLRRRRPDAILSSQADVSLAVMTARKAHPEGRYCLWEHFVIARDAPTGEFWHSLYRFMGETYRRADAVIAVSNGTADALSELADVDRNHIRTVYNPIAVADAPKRIRRKENEPPIILGMGRLTYQKNFGALIRAFAAVRKKRPCKLRIVGEGDQRKNLERLVAVSGCAKDIELPGFVTHPLDEFRRADVFALSSRYEGFGNVLVEALACGCPTAANDCPSGPREILNHGQFGELVPNGNVTALAEAIERLLNEPPDPNHLKRRAKDFEPNKIIPQFMEILNP